jgi:chitodextrinase
MFRDGTRVGQVTATNFVDTRLTAATSHVYVVSAYDTSNNASANSASLTVSTATADDNKKPTVPTGVTASATSVSSIDVSWHASTDNNGVTGYQVFRDGVKVADVAAPTTSFSDYGLNEHTTYAYTVRAVDLAGNRSAASQSASATTLSAPPPASPSPTPEPTDTYTPPAPVVLSIAITRSTIAPPTCTTQLSITVYTSGAMNVDLSYDIAGDTGILEVPVDGSGANTVPIGLPADGVQAGSAHVEVQGNSAIADDSSWSAHPECPPPTETPTPTPTDTDGGSGGGDPTDAP